ncbi:uncharacterized protein LOC107273242 [Cephus cinctus]|uniref:Uncharacterized protein LOC107273242 n=1 Tax=Cephus cinctus TaxID=211228 RepID=A0AAJ7CCN3_CEPCN|nr:uncharacterized protein LOC107273242 [Cephus cinctus]
MATRKYAVFLHVTVLLSISSLIIICISMGTEGWISAPTSVVRESQTIEDSDVNHGLFKGTLIRRLVQTPRNYDIYITCVWSSNACAWSCLADASARVAEVKSLLAGESPSFACLTSTRTLATNSSIKSTNGERLTLLFLGEHFYISYLYSDTGGEQFFNAGAWLCTVIAMSLLMLAVVLTIAVTFLNIFKNPAETLLNIEGIYWMNAITVGLNVLVLLIFGIHYALVTQYGVAIRDTIVGEYVSNASLGYSYWLLLAPVSLHLTNIGMLYLREKIVTSEPAEPKFDIENISDGMIALF